ncbi:MAG: SDR family NAD(P)-dependent oxidoreductase [Isosphaeraceae bacterium]
MPRRLATSTPATTEAETPLGSVGWGPGETWPLGQDAAFASLLADRFVTVGGIVQAVDAAIDEGLAAARRFVPLAEGSLLAQSHGTRYPIVQGPMTRVSDRAGFARSVATEGALPLLALAMMRRDEVNRTLTEVEDALEGRPWGVGLLGFLPTELREEQIREVLAHRPPFALIAGGRPDQARELEQAGIRTYLHAPSPRLLEQFLRDGARRFVLEGSECGGHVGPRTSAILWEQAVRVLLDRVDQGMDATELHVLFAGGVHDARSSAFVAATAALLAARGVKVGVLMGTAYLFTEEAVASGAIVEGFQREAIGCASTVLLETGPGHVVRVSPSPFVDDFTRERERLQRAGQGPDAIREALEGLNVGRLRIAAKGLDRANGRGGPLVPVEPEGQRARGLYMLGEVASLRDRVTTIAALHQAISTEGTARLLQEGVSETPIRKRRARPSNVAIIGMASVVPGAAEARAFWENTLRGVDAITEVPEDLWDWRIYFDVDPKAPDKITSRWGGFVPEIPFDPVRHGMPPASVASIEPLQLITLEVARAAIQDAGYARRPFPRERTAVVIGAGGGAAQLAMGYAFRSYLPMLDTVFPGAGTEALQRCRSLLPEWTEDSFPGILLNVAAGRVANRFDLGGANYTVDAACGSSLAAAATAVRELESGAADLVLLGGADTVQNPFTYLAFSKTQAFSPRGRCRPFDAKADGIVISEAVAVVVLKRLADAERDGDRIYAVIKGLGSSSDGRAKGLTAPRREGQVRALRRAYEKAGISPATVGYVEAHGTGTAVGDVAEVRALTDVFQEAGAEPGRCALGSVKSLIGHTKCAAGLAGLINASLALHHRVLPPTIGVETPNPKADLAGGPFHLSTRARPWARTRPDLPRRAGVSAFGFGGTNFHAVLEAYEERDVERPPAIVDWSAELFLWRATHTEALIEQVDRLRDALRADPSVPPRDVAHALAVDTFGNRGIALDEPETRLGLVASTVADLLAKLDAIRPRLSNPAEAFVDPSGVSFSGRPRKETGQLAFLFPGQGSQSPGMLEELSLHFPELASSFDDADRTLAARGCAVVGPLVFAPPTWSAGEAEARAKRLAAPEVVQPALGAAAVGLLDLLNRLRIEPQMLAGHSYGELVALHAAGVFDRERLTILSEARGRLLRDAAGAEPGIMAAMRASDEQVQSLLRNIPGVVVANHNGPSQTVISGTATAVRQVVETAKAQGISAQVVPVACAFHSPLVASASGPLAALVAEANLDPPRWPVYSNLTAAPYPVEPHQIASQVGEHLRGRVRFADMVVAMHDAGARVFVEVGPGGVLTSLLGSILQGRDHLAVALDGPGRRGLAGLFQSLARLFTAGIDLDPRPLTAHRSPGALRWRGGSFERDVPKPSATTWLVNGTRARPAVGPEPPRFGPGRPLPQTEKPSPLALPSFETAGRSGSPAGPADKVLAAFQENMRTFLDVQRSTMLSYLSSAPVVVGHAPSSNGVASHSRNGKSHVEEPPRATRPVEGSVRDRLIEIIGGRTGYPTELLGLEMDLEADLGIDSIKRVEILGSLRDSFPERFDGSESDVMERLSRARTLGAIVEELDRAHSRPNLATQGGHHGNGVPNGVVDPPPLAIGTRRMRPQLVEAPLAEAARAFDFQGGVVVIVDDGPELSVAVAERLLTQGLRPIRVRRRSGAFQSFGDAAYELDLASESEVAKLSSVVREKGRVVGLLHLSGWSVPETIPLASVWADLLAPELQGAFLLARAFAPDLEESARRGGAFFLAATAMGGAFGSEPGPHFTFATGQGALAGLVKSLAREWPSVRVRVVDVDPNESHDRLASRLLAEINADDPRFEVGYRRGNRVAPLTLESPLIRSSEPSFTLPERAPILFTGGARGITAAVAEDFAERWRPTILLLGTTTLPDEPEPEALARLTDPGAIKGYLLSQLRTNGSSPTPTVLERAYREVARVREIRDTLGRLKALGAQAEYAARDVRDASGLKATLDRWKETHGPLAGFVHGAGLIEDRPLRDKTLESFNRVVGVKLEGALNLASLVDPTSLRFAAFFSSVAGRFGNLGQTDYASANEALNKLALWLDHRWDCRVVSMIWGPWAGSGMAHQIGDRFARRGIGMIDPVDGKSRLAEELLHGREGEVEIIVSGALGDLSDTTLVRTGR